MAKSIRSKAKMASRARKRQSSHYALAEAARTQRLSEKLLGKSKSEEGGKAGDEKGGDAADAEDAEMAVSEEPKKISTAGPRNSRREQWRTSKGLSARPKKSAKGSGKNQRRR